MVDIKLQLVDLDVELDVPQDRQFPLSLNFTAGTLKDIEARSSNYSLEFRIPATKNNKSALDHLDSSNIDDGNNVLGKNPCVVKANGLPVFNGDFKLLGTVDDRGHKEFKCIILGHAHDWHRGMKDKKLKDVFALYNWGTFTFSKANVQSSWSNTYTDGYVFPLINYGAWRYARKVKPEEFRPAVFMRSLFEKAFEAEGYTLQTDTDTNDFFHTTNNPLMDDVIVPFTGDGWSLKKEDTDTEVFEANTYDDYDTYTSYGELKDYRVVYPKTVKLSGDYTIKTGLNKAGEVISGKDVRRYFLTTTPTWTMDSNTYLIPRTRSNSLLTPPNGKVYSIVGYGYGYNSDPWGSGSGAEAGTKFYVDLLTDDVLPTIYTQKDSNDSPELFNMAIAEIISGTDNPFQIDFDDVTDVNGTTGSTGGNFSAVTDKYVATDARKMRFNFSAKFYAFGGEGLNNITDINQNEGDFTFRIVHVRSGVKTVRGEERYIYKSNAPESNINEYEPKISGASIYYGVNEVGFESGVIDVENGDEVYVELVSRFKSLITVVNAIKKLDIQKYSLICKVKECSFSSVPQFDIVEDATFDIEEKLEDRYSVLSYIKGCIHAFNLMIDTDRATKTVKIKTRSDFYEGITNAVDWTSKIDLKKQYVIDYIDYYKRYLDFKFKTDASDGYVKELNAQEDTQLGAYREDIGERFAEGIQKMENPLFAYTHHLIDKALAGGDQAKGVFVSRIWREYTPNSVAPAKNYNVQPRLLFYKYSQQDGTNRFFMYDDTKTTTIPNALPCDFGTATPDLNIGQHLGYDPTETGDTGLVENYYDNTINTIEKGIKLTIPLVLDRKDIQTFDISKPIYFSYPDEIKGYWIVDSINQYLPTTNVSTTVELIKYEDYSKRTVDTSKAIFFDRDGDEWRNESEEKIDIGSGKTGDPKYLTEEQEEARSNSDRAIVIDANKGGVSNSDEKKANIGSFGSPAPASSAKTSLATIDEEAEATSRDDARSQNWTNDKGVVAAEKYPTIYRDPEEKFQGGNNVDPSVVQRSRNNSSVRGGNAVFGTGNIATGKHQTVVGQYSEPKPNAAFAVGTGTSKEDRATPFSVGKDGIVREGGGVIVEEVNGVYQPVYEEVNGEIVKVTL